MCFCIDPSLPCCLGRSSFLTGGTGAAPAGEARGGGSKRGRHGAAAGGQVSMGFALLPPFLRSLLPLERCKARKPRCLPQQCFQNEEEEEGGRDALVLF